MRTNLKGLAYLRAILNSQKRLQLNRNASRPIAVYGPARFPLPSGGR